VIGEIRVRDLGVIEDVDLTLEPGLTVITGETGAGKTLVVEALQLLLGARADPAIVRSGATECRVEGRFGVGEDEVVLTRVVPSSGRARAYVDDRMTPAGVLESTGADLVDIHGQHDHQSLLRPATQRSALDHFAGVDLSEVTELRRALSALSEKIEALGGDDASRERRLDLLRFERDEIARAALSSPDELAALEEEEERLAAATAVRAAAAAAHDLLVADEMTRDLLGRATEAVASESLLGDYVARLRGLLAEVDDLADELRREAERAEEDPERLAAVQERRLLLTRLARKHGGTLTDVLRVYDEISAEIDDLDGADEARAVLERERAEINERLADAERTVGDLRRGSARSLSSAVAAHFSDLALAHATFDVVVSTEPFGGTVEFVFQANPGEAVLPLAKVASGGELARVMLALRLVLSSGPPTLVFDEVDAGIGGEVGLAVGLALAALAAERQVLVVTHLAQIAAYADHHLVVEKRVLEGRTRSVVRSVSGEERIVELSRMLSGHPDSAAARDHASELIALGRTARGAQAIRASAANRL
jgi:DNA repair protein RecN (Recombination protein N)